MPSTHRAWTCRAAAFAALFTITVAGWSAAQQAKVPVTAGGSSAPVAATETTPAAQGGYSYNPAGRRDPFVSLVNRGTIDIAKKKADGLRGFTFADIKLTGIIHGGTNAVALVQGPDMKTYRVRVGDQFFDGVVKAITADSLVALLEVNDPLSLTKQREVRKMLRVVEEVK